jgi:hypothetical protein
MVAGNQNILGYIRNPGISPSLNRIHILSDQEFSPSDKLLIIFTV